MGLETIAAIGVPAIIGGMGLMQAQDAQISANRQNAKATKQADWLRALAEQMLKETAKAVKGGEFDTNALVKEATRLSNQQMGDAASNAAGALRIAGYAPGDTPMDNTLAGIAANYAKELANKRMQLGQQNLMNLLQAYNASGATMAGNAAQIYQQQANVSQNLANQGFAGASNLLGVIGQYLPQKSGSVNMSPVVAGTQKSSFTPFTPIGSISEGLYRQY